MLSPQLARQILHTVNLQINSNTIVIKPNPHLNIINRFNLYRDTNKAIKQLDKSYPSEKLNKKDHLLSQFALLYSNFRTAFQEQDQPMLHRYLTNGLYQQWKQKRKTAFNPYPIQAQLYENQHGKWIQCLVKFKFGTGNNNRYNEIFKQHVIERKLKMMTSYPRTWYFATFQS